MTKKDITTYSDALPSKTKKPRYEKIKQSILERIHDNNLKPGDKLPTEVELCQHFGWSRMTISRALNDLALEGIVKRVRGSGTYLAEKKSLNRPFRIMISEMALKQGERYLDEVYQGVREIAATEKVDIIYYPEKVIPSPQIAANSNANGILVLAPNIKHIPPLLKLQETGLPLVAMAIKGKFGKLATVCTDNFGGMHEAVTHLTSLGHKRIAFATSGLISSDVQERIEGFYAACFQAGIAIDPKYLLLFPTMISTAVLKAWFESLSPRPTAIIVNSQLAFTIQNLLWNRNLQIPKDMSLIVTDDSELFRGCDPQLTVIRQPLVEMGRRGIKKLIRMLEGKEDSKLEILPMELIVRDSVAPVCDGE